MARVTAIAMFKRALLDESAATLVEYALLVTLIAIACIGALLLLYTRIASFFTTVGNAM